MKIEIDKAKKKDSPIVVRLMLNALGDYANFLMISENISTILDRLQTCYISEKTISFIIQIVLLPLLTAS